jgi:hypothetical protein
MATSLHGRAYVVGLAAMLALANGSTAKAENRIFVLERPESGLLCGFVSEHQWAQFPREKNDVDIVAVASRVDGVVSSILVERFTEDTATYDEYSIDRKGNINRLKRTFDVVPDRVTREQIWSIRDGKAVKTSESWMEFKTHRPIAPHKEIEDFGTSPIILRMADFPFYSLIIDRHPERWPSGNLCIPGSMNKLEAPEK